MDRISTEQQIVDKAKFDKGFDNIFGKPKAKKSGGYVQCPETGKLVPRGEYIRPKDGVNAPMVMGMHQDFVSPIDQTVISSRAKLEAHNRKHGVTNSSDYSNGYIENKARQRNERGEKYLRDTRRSDIGDAIDRHRR